MKKLALAPLLCLLAVATTLQSQPQAQAQNLEQRFDALIEQGLKDDPQPGIAVGIVQHGRLVYSRGFGAQRLGSPAVPMTERTLFHMASITKTFVATSVMQLWEQGKVDLDAPVTKYVPYFRIDDLRYTKITVRQMLSHSSGMPDVDDYEWNKPQTDDAALERYVRGLSGMKLKLLFDPGTGWSYSNMAYEVLGDAIAKVSGMTFEDYVAKNILLPLGMNNSTLLLSKADPKLLAEGYTRPRDGDYASLKPVAAYPFNRMHSPSSDLMSNVVDMSRWALANLNHGELDGHRILKRETHDLMWKPAVQVERCRGENHTDCEKLPAHIGLSWFIEPRDGHTIFYHGGGDDGFRTVIVLIPDLEMALMWMCNSAYPGMSLPQKVSAEFRKLAAESAK